MANCLARALYDNIAESPDELAFQKGEILTVIEQNTSNIEGWWLCALRGRQGLCPGNRLQIIPGVFEDIGSGRDVLSFGLSSELNILQQQGKRRSWHVQPNKVLTPKKYKDVYLYEDPPQRYLPVPVGNHFEPNTECYDVPPRAMPVCVRNCPRSSPIGHISPVNRDCTEDYDVPRPLAHLHSQLTPSSSVSSLTTDSLSSSNRSSFANIPDYDVPKPITRPVVPMQLYDIPNSHQHLKELPLELSFALETLEKLQSETTSAISKLLQFASPSWRLTEKLESNLMDIKLAVIRLRTALHDFAEFSERVLGNAAKVSDKSLVSKLSPLVISLQNSDVLVSKISEKLQQQNWCIDLLQRPPDEDKIYKKPDELEQLISCSRGLIEDIRQISSFIQGNGTLLFKKDAANPNNDNNNTTSLPEDYDYVNLDTTETVAKQHAEISNSLPLELKKGYDNLVKISGDISVDNGKILDPDEKEVVLFFATQAVTHHHNLTQAIDAFLQTVEHNQPPRIFLAHGKFVVLSAHKLIYIGDAVHRSVTRPDLKLNALNCANALSEALATTVSKTKQAALQFPSVTAVQEMVDSVVDISHSARDVKLCLVQAMQSYD